MGVIGVGRAGPALTLSPAVGYTGRGGRVAAGLAVTNISIDQWRHAILFVIALVISVGLHEFAHAFVATRLGDTVPRSQGRLTLNPVRHADPIGTLLFPFILAASSTGLMFGWGRPVMTNPSNYTRRLSRPTGSMLVSLAGPAMNVLLAFIVSIIVVLGLRTGVMGEDLAEGLVRYLIQLNLVLAFFNLLPIPPLDGGAVLAWVLPRSMQGVIEFLNKWGFLILLGLVLIPGVLPTIMAPAYDLFNFWVMALKGLTGA
jgi:Zn-dependent protease